MLDKAFYSEVNSWGSAVDQDFVMSACFEGRLTLSAKLKRYVYVCFFIFILLLQIIL